MSERNSVCRRSLEVTSDIKLALGSEVPPREPLDEFSTALQLKYMVFHYGLSRQLTTSTAGCRPCS